VITAGGYSQGVKVDALQQVVLRDVVPAPHISQEDGAICHAILEPGRRRGERRWERRWEGERERKVLSEVASKYLAFFGQD